MSIVRQCTVDRRRTHHVGGPMAQNAWSDWLDDVFRIGDGLALVRAGDTLTCWELPEPGGWQE